MGKIPLVYWWDELAMRGLVCAGTYPPLGSPHPAAQVPWCPYRLGLPRLPAGPQTPPQTQLCLIVIQTAQGRECVNSSCFILSLPPLRET